MKKHTILMTKIVSKMIVLLYQVINLLVMKQVNNITDIIIKIPQIVIKQIQLKRMKIN